MSKVAKSPLKSPAPLTRRVSLSKSETPHPPKFVSPRRKTLSESPNTYRRPSVESCQGSDDLDLKKVNARVYAKRMAWDEDYTCPHHDGSIVVLFCHTCEELICAKCVSHGAAGVRTPGAGGPHTDHLYLDVQEAYELKRVTHTTLNFSC